MRHEVAGAVMSKRRRCDARTRRDPSTTRFAAAFEHALREGRERKFLRGSSRCKNWALPGSKRCRLHGGMSTGPRTPEGMARTVAAMVEGRRRWLAQLQAEGKKAPCGRKMRGHNRPAEEREHAAYERECLRKWRQMERSQRDERKARRHEERRKAADHARRKARWDAGGPYWTDEEWEKM
jgi:hypothetical protein